jgi:hypothetical protein
MGSCVSHVDPESLKLHAEAEEVLKKVSYSPCSPRPLVAEAGKLFCCPLHVSEILQEVHQMHLELQMA